MLRKLWNDEGGAILSAEIVLIATILVIGVVTGLTSVRDAVVTELADVGAAIGSVDQSYVWHGVTAHSAATAGSEYVDQPDFCDDDQTTTAERCVVVCGGAFANPIDGPDGG